MSLLLNGYLKVITGDYEECYKFYQSDFFIASPDDLKKENYLFTISFNDCEGKFICNECCIYNSFDYLHSFVNSAMFQFLKDRYISPDCVEVYIY